MTPNAQLVSYWHDIEKLLPGCKDVIVVSIKAFCVGSPSVLRGAVARDGKR